VAKNFGEELVQFIGVPRNDTDYKTIATTVVTLFSEAEFRSVQNCSADDVGDTRPF